MDARPDARRRARSSIARARRDASQPERRRAGRRRPGRSMSTASDGRAAAPRRTTNRCQACSSPAPAAGSISRPSPRQVREALEVASGDRGPRRAQLRRPLQLDQPDRRREVRQVVLEPGRLDLVVPAAGGRVALPGVAADAVEAHRPRPVGERRVVGREHPALAGRDRLGRVEAERPGAPDRPGEPPAERRRSGDGKAWATSSMTGMPPAAARTPREVGRQTRRCGRPRPRASADRSPPRPPPGRRSPSAGSTSTRTGRAPR